MRTVWTPWHQALFIHALDTKPKIPFSRAVEMRLDFTFKMPKRKPKSPYWFIGVPDLDNLEKGVGDILQKAGVLVNDSLIVHSHASKHYGPGDSLAIEIQEVEQ